MPSKNATPDNRRAGRRPTGGIRERVGSDGVTVHRLLRYRVNGVRYSKSLGAVGRDEAERELRGVLSDIERKQWTPPVRHDFPTEEPTFHEYADQWFEKHRLTLRPSAVADYTWRLECHLLPFFKDDRLGDITYQRIKEYVTAKQTETTRLRAEGKKGLGNESINKTLGTLSMVLQQAMREDLINRNPVKLGGLRLRTSTSKGSYLPRADQIEALLDAAGDLDAEARADRRAISRRACLAVMVFGGLRIGEITNLRWRDVDLANGELRVTDSKTDTGIRNVRLLPVLLDELKAWKATAGNTAPAAFVFPRAGSGKRQSTDNMRSRVFGLSLKRAEEKLEAEGFAPLPDDLTPHSLRRTCISILLAVGHEVPFVMQQAGHKDPKVTLGIYAKVMYREPGERERLRELVFGKTSDAVVGGLQGAPVA